MTGPLHLPHLPHPEGCECSVCLSPEVFRRDPLAERLNDLLAEVLDEARQLHHDSASDETFTSCALCCGWEGDHSPACPVKAISYWLDTQLVTPATPEDTHGTRPKEGQ